MRGVKAKTLRAIASAEAVRNPRVKAKKLYRTMKKEYKRNGKG